MAIEKKSLISNRTATKKALVAKPEVSKATVTRLAKPRLTMHTSPKVAMAKHRVALPRVTAAHS